MINYDRLAAEYARHRQVHPGVLMGLLNHGQVRVTSHVLEIGSGTGNYIAAIESAVGCRCWGAEPSEEMLAWARARARTIEWRTGRGEHLPFLADFFDLAFSVDVIHHVEDRAAYFGEACRVLKKGGRLCTVTDSDEIILQRRPLSVYFPETAAADLLRYPRVTELYRLMEQAGFDHITEEHVSFPYERTDIEAFRDKAYSVLHLISEDAFQRGIERMEQDLQEGPIPCVASYVLVWGTKR